MNQPIEEWPAGTGSQTLLQWQTNNDGSDRHSIVVQPGAGLIYETWMALRTGTNWQAANGAMFNLNTNGLRPDGWTSGDAAGFPMFPGAGALRRMRAWHGGARVPAGGGEIAQAAPLSGNA
jgi:hypothetical protein